MKTIRFFRLLVLRIVILSIITFMWSFITEFIQENSNFFKDFQYKRYSFDKQLSWEWGWRHYIWNITGILLLITSVFRIIVWGNWYWEQMDIDDDVDLKSPENKIF